jgi:large subunit ribosomal protein L10
MPQPRADKEKVVGDLTTRLAHAESVFLADYAGLNVEAVTDMRRQLRGGAVECHVAKNTLLHLAFQEAGLPSLDEYLTGPTAVIISKDPVVSAKLLSDFSKSHDNRPRIKGGLLTGTIINADQVQELAKLPSREELIARVVGGVAAPLTGLVFSLSGILGNLVRVLAAVADKKTGQDAGS